MQPRASNSFESSSSQNFLSAIANDPAIEGRRSNLPGGTTIYEADAPATHVHVIHRGQVRLYQPGENGASRLCEILGANEWFGVGSLAQSPTYGVRAVAVGATVVTEIRADRLLGALMKQPEAMIELTRQLSCRVQIARDESAELMFRDTNHRLVNALLRFADSAASTRRDQDVVLSITHSQLAQAVGAARETISLALTQLRHQKLIRTGRNQLIFNPDVLSKRRRDEHAVENVA